MENDFGNKEEGMDPNNLALAIDFRHLLHKNPELSNHEFETIRRIQFFLRQHTKLRIVNHKDWFYAVYDDANSNSSGIAFRCEMDALPIEDDIDKPWRSVVKDVGHKCGHDGHIATMLALALEVDKTGADKNVYFLFQPAEETGDGALKCIPLLQENKIDMLYAFHNCPGIPLGYVQIMDGTYYCASKGIIIYYKGIPSHAAYPEKGKNPVFAFVNIVNAIGQLTDPAQYKGMVLCTVIQLDIGKPAFGTQASSGKLLLTMRARYENEMNILQDKIETLAKKQAKKHGLKVNFDYCDSFPETTNNKLIANRVRSVCKELGVPIIERTEPYRTSEDLGYLSKLVPTAVFEIGSGEDCPELHTAQFDFPDEIIEIAVEIKKRLIELPISKN